MRLDVLRLAQARTYSPHAERSEAERPGSVLPGRSAVARSSSELNGTSSELVGRFWAVLSDRVSGKLHFAPLSSSEAPIKWSFRGSQISSAIRLEVLRLSQRDRPKTRPSGARQRRPALDSPARRARRPEMAGPGPRHPEARRSRERPTERYVKYPAPRSELASDDGRRTTVRRGLFGITSSWTASGGSILDRASAHLRRTLAEMTKANPWISA
jgi:hypothetical protein